MNTFLPTKRLGQHFLIDASILSRIVDSCELCPNDEVLEIGPGQGALTRGLIPRVKKLIAVEADPVLADSLGRELSASGLLLHNTDFLKFDLHGLFARPFKVIGNIPYNISTPIVEKMLADRSLVRSLYLTVQYEFARRLTAPVGTKDRSALTCLLEVFATSRILFRISNQAFRPIPKVESCFIHIDFQASPGFPVKDEAFFSKVVKTAFLQRRKTLVNALLPLGAKARLESALAFAGVDKKTRPEDVRSADYVRIANHLLEGG
ncbi:MAG: ribosomal RNA small subunit methyltransferase A [Candidatus Omnitrophica bacterium]|nr:ribosomal RNA small subunit methyltransferase A [Candidatus Omnitrophota bacterium]